jgi:peroxiredoxin
MIPYICFVLLQLLLVLDLAVGFGAGGFGAEEGGSAFGGQSQLLRLTTSAQRPDKSIPVCCFDYTQQSAQLEGDSLTVYVFLEDECIISQFFTPELTRLYEKYHAQHVGFVGYFPSAETDIEQITWFGSEFRIAFPLLADHDKSLCKKLGITITPEVAVWDHRSNQMIYRGRIDDSYVRVGKRKLHPQSHDLDDIIHDWTLNQTPEVLVKTQAIGCFITFE